MPKIISDSEYVDTPLVNALLTEMRAQKLSPRALGLKASMSGDAVRNILRGRSGSPRESTVRALASALGVPITVLLEGGERQPTPYKIGARNSPLPIFLDIPEVSLRSATGPSISALQPIEMWKLPFRMLDETLAAPSNLRFIRLHENMPHIGERGDRILVDLGQEPRPGVFLAWDGWKHIGLLLEPAGPEKLLVNGTATHVDEISVYGQVIGRYSFL